MSKTNLIIFGLQALFFTGFFRQNLMILGSVPALGVTEAVLEGFFNLKNLSPQSDEEQSGLTCSLFR